MSPALFSASPFHLGKMIAFSGWRLTCSGTVSMTITLLKSRFKYVKSCSRGWSAGRRRSRQRYEADLDDFAIHGPCRFTEKFVRDVQRERVDFLQDGIGRLWVSIGQRPTPPWKKKPGATDEGYLRCKNDNLIELRQVRNKVVNSRAFCRAPAVLALRTIGSGKLQ